MARLPNIEDRPHQSFGPNRLLGVLGERSRQLTIWDLSEAEPALKLKCESVQSFDFGADGSHVVVDERTGWTRLYETSTGREISSGQSANEVYGSEVLLHPSEPFFVTQSYFSNPFELRDARSSAVVARVVPPWSGGNGRGAWHPDGRHFAIPDGNGGRVAVYEFDLDQAVRESQARGAAATVAKTTGHSVTTPRDAELARVVMNGGLALSFNSAGDRIVGRGWNGIVYLWDWQSGRLLFSSLSTEPASRWYATWDTSGKRLGFGRTGERQDQVGLFSIADGREYRWISPPIKYDRGRAQQAIHPNGRMLAFRGVKR